MECHGTGDGKDKLIGLGCYLHSTPNYLNVFYRIYLAA